MQLQTEILATCLHARISGQFEAESAMAIQERIFAQARQASQRAILIEVRELRGAPEVMQRYKLALSIAEESHRLTRALGTKVRVAFLGDDPVIAPDHFGEDVAVNRGANMRVFTDEAEALEWLRAP